MRVSSRGEYVGSAKNEKGPDVFSDRSPFHVQTKPEGIRFLSRYRKKRINRWCCGSAALTGYLKSFRFLFTDSVRSFREIRDTDKSYDCTRIDLHYLRRWAGCGAGRHRHRYFNGLAAGAQDEPIA